MSLVVHLFLFVCLSVCLFVCLFIHLFICLFIGLFVLSLSDLDPRNIHQICSKSVHYLNDLELKQHSSNHTDLTNSAHRCRYGIEDSTYACKLQWNYFKSSGIKSRSFSQESKCLPQSFFAFRLIWRLHHDETLPNPHRQGTTAILSLVN